MTDKMTFSEDFIKALDTLKIDTNRALIYSVHVVASNELDTSRKDSYSNDIGQISTELKNAILKFDLKTISNFNIREREKAFSRAAESIHKDFSRLFEQVDKKYNVIIDKKTLFKISDVVKNLKDSSYKAEYLITADKIDNLLSIKTLIIQIYESQIKKAVEKEKEMDRQFIELKEKTFLQMIHGNNSNATYLFKACELMRKYISQETKAKISSEDAKRERNVIEYWGNESSGLNMSYSSDGLSVFMRIGKIGEGNSLRYDVGGFIEKGTAKVEYMIREFVSFDKELVFERVSGLDCILEQYEKAFIEFRSKENDGKKREENLNKSIVDKAIDDILFN